MFVILSIVQAIQSNIAAGTLTQIKKNIYQNIFLVIFLIIFPYYKIVFKAILVF
jgi:hypothetical protein